MAIEMGGVTFTPGTYRSTSAINIAAGTTVVFDGGNPEPYQHQPFSAYNGFQRHVDLYWQ